MELATDLAKHITALCDNCLASYPGLLAPAFVACSTRVNVSTATPGYEANNCLGISVSAVRFRVRFSFQFPVIPCAPLLQSNAHSCIVYIETDTLEVSPIIVLLMGVVTQLK